MPSCKVERDRDIAHHTDCDVYIGRGLRETFGRNSYVIGARKQTLNAKFSAIICYRLAGDGRSCRPDDDQSTGHSRATGVLDLSPQRAVGILCIRISGYEYCGHECEYCGDHQAAILYFGFHPAGFLTQKTQVDATWPSCWKLANVNRVAAWERSQAEKIIVCNAIYYQSS